MTQQSPPDPFSDQSFIGPAPPESSAPRDSSVFRIFRNSGWLLGGKTVGALLSLVYLALITHSLGPAGFGTFALIFSFAQLISGLVAFQTWQIIIRFGTPHVLEKRHDRFAQLVMLCLAFDFASFIVGAVIMGIGTFALGAYYGWTSNFSWFVLSFNLVILIASRATAAGILRVHDNYRDAALGDTLVPVIRFVGILAAVAWTPTLTNFLIVWAVSEIVPTLLMWFMIIRTVRMPLRQQSIKRLGQYYRDCPGIGRFAAFSNIGSSMRLANQQLVVVIVGLYTGATAAGFFRLGHQLGQVLARIADGFGFVLFTEYNRISHTEGHDAVRSLVAKTIRVAGIGALILTAILIFAGKAILINVFGADFAPAYPLVVLLGGAAALQVAAVALEPVLLSRGQAGQTLIANALGAGALLILIPFLLAKYGAVGAATAVLIATITTTAWLVKVYTATQKD